MEEVGEIMENKDEYVRAVGRALKILKLFENDYEKTLIEISNDSGLSKTTALRLISTLETEGFLQHQENGKYKLGVEVLKLGYTVERNNDIISMATPIMKELCKITNETICLNAIIDYNKVCIFKIEGNEPIRQFVEVGKPTCLYKGASGKLLLAFSDEDTIDKVINDIDDEDSEFINNLRKDLEKIKKEGVIASMNERVVGAISISAPIFNKYGELDVGITISSATIRHTFESISEFKKLLSEKAHEISTLLGYKE